MLSEIVSCEPNLSLPQRIDLDELRHEIMTDQNGPKRPQKEKNLIREIVDNHLFAPIGLPVNNVMPIEIKARDKLKDILSIPKNDYLLKRWDKFLEDIPNNYVVIESFAELQL